MKALQLLSILGILTFASCEGMLLFNDGITKKDVYGEWRPVEYERDGIKSEPTSEQRNDFIRLNEDNTFTCREMEMVVEGTWYFNALNNSINIMTDENPDNCIPYMVRTVTDNEMVYTVPATDGGTATTVKLVK